MANTKEVLEVRPHDEDPDVYWVKYKGHDGLLYWKRVEADNELDAYMRVMGIRKPTRR